MPQQIPAAGSELRFSKILAHPTPIGKQFHGHCFNSVSAVRCTEFPISAYATKIITLVDEFSRRTANPVQTASSWVLRHTRHPPAVYCFLTWQKLSGRCATSFRILPHAFPFWVSAPCSWAWDWRSSHGPEFRTTKRCFLSLSIRITSIFLSVLSTAMCH